MIMRILANDGIDKIAADELAARGFEIDRGHYAKEELKAQIKDFDVLIVRSATKVDQEIIDAAAQGDHVHVGGVDLLPLEGDAPLDAHVVHQVVHAVETA